MQTSLSLVCWPLIDLSMHHYVLCPLSVNHFVHHTLSSPLSVCCPLFLLGDLLELLATRLDARSLAGLQVTSFLVDLRHSRIARWMNEWMNERTNESAPSHSQYTNSTLARSRSHNTSSNTLILPQVIVFIHPLTHLFLPIPPSNFYRTIESTWRSG